MTTAEYMRDYRNRRGPAYSAWESRTRARALSRLASEQRDRFRVILAEIRSEDPAPRDGLRSRLT